MKEPHQLFPPHVFQLSQYLLIFQQAKQWKYPTRR